MSSGGIGAGIGSGSGLSGQSGCDSGLSGTGSKGEGIAHSCNPNSKISPNIQQSDKTDNIEGLHRTSEFSNEFQSDKKHNDNMMAEKADNKREPSHWQAETQHK